MPTESRSATIDAPVEAVWNLLADIKSWPRWLRVPYASESVAVVSGAPTEVGTEFAMKGRLSFRLFARLARFEEMRLIAFDIQRSEYPSDRLFFARASITIELRGLDDGRTRVTCTHGVEGKGLLGRLYMATVFRPFLSSNVRRIVRSLARAV